eukprot:9482921-Pyramimonas_sp.AAC.1
MLAYFEPSWWAVSGARPSVPILQEVREEGWATPPGSGIAAPAGFRCFRAPRHAAGRRASFSPARGNYPRRE